MRTRQVFDFPKPQMRVTEHVTYEKVCPGCGKVHKTEFPSGGYPTDAIWSKHAGIDELPHAIPIDPPGEGY